METNWEYWQIEIREIENNHGGVAIVNDEPEVCSDVSCLDCIRNNDGNCSLLAAFEWGAREHKTKPLLFSNEAELIRLITEHYGCKVKIIRRGSGDGGHILVFEGRSGNTGQINIVAGSFEAMELDKEYTAEELI